MVTIDWTKPIEHIDGTPLVFAPNHRQPDDMGDYFVIREDGEPFTREQGGYVTLVSVVKPDGRYWRGRDSGTVFVRNRAAFGHGTTGAQVPVNESDWQTVSSCTLTSDGQIIHRGAFNPHLRMIRAVIDALKSDPQLLADVRELLTVPPVNDTCPQDAPTEELALYARPSKGCDYITAGKLYRVLGGDDDSDFRITDDDGDFLYCLWDACGHLDGGSWERVWLPEGADKC